MATLMPTALPNGPATYSVEYTPVHQFHSGVGAIHTYLTPTPVLNLDQQDEKVDLLIGEVRTGPLPIDMPSWKTLSGVIIILIMVMSCLSLFICLGRTDFNLVFYLMGYYVWCLESERHPDSYAVSAEQYPRTSRLYVATKRTWKSLKHYTMALGGASLIDITWLFLAWSTWFCGDSDKESCYAEQNKRLLATYTMHRFVFYGSVTNLVFKVVVIILSIVWLLQQKRHYNNLVGNRFGS